MPIPSEQVADRFIKRAHVGRRICSETMLELALGVACEASKNASDSPVSAVERRDSFVLGLFEPITYLACEGFLQFAKFEAGRCWHVGDRESIADLQDIYGIPVEWCNDSECDLPVNELVSRVLGVCLEPEMKHWHQSIMGKLCSFAS